MVETQDVSLHFSRELRLLKRSDFSYVFESPIRVGNKAFTLLARQNTLGYPRLGLAIAKKQVKLAVARNRIKRKLRESFRLRQHSLASYDFVVLVRRDINQLDSVGLNKSIDHLWRKVDKVCERSSSD